MKYLLLLITATMMISCNMTTPEQYFDRAVLNANMVTGFGNAGFSRQLASPSVKLSEKTGKAAPMLRKEVVDQEVTFLEEALEKIKALKQTDDTKEMVQASLGLYNFVIPVYKNEYQKLAQLYDSNAPEERIIAQETGIHDKYFPEFETRYNKLIELGKVYAKKNSINVQWDIHTSPQ